MKRNQREKGPTEKEGTPWEIDSRFETFEGADLRRTGLFLEHGPEAPVKVKRVKGRYVVKTRFEAKPDKKKRKSRKKKNRE
jgi:hypothetical protein|tara:strand:+ start:1412 stop:1654 length:243 start_codon:yes stop_codon:yes gene_type:complete